MTRQRIALSSLVFLVCLSAARTADAGCPSLAWDCFYARSIGVLYLSPALASSEEVALSNVDGPAQLVIDNGPIAGSSAGVGDLMLPAMSVGFVVGQWADGRYALSIETVLAPPNLVKIEMTAEGTIAYESLAPRALGDIPTGIPALGNKLGTIEALPPMVTAVFRPLADHRVQPYVGAGLAYLYILGGTITNELLTAVAEPVIEPNHGVGNLGWVAQVGGEARIATWRGRDLFINADVKYIGNLTVTATVTNMFVEAPGLPVFGAVRVGDATAQVTVNPIIVQLGAGINF